MKVRRFRQFYVEFPFKRSVDGLGRLAAHAVNVLADRELDLELLEFKPKSFAGEYRVLAIMGVEVKVGTSADKAWVHVSVPADSEVDPRSIAEDILREYASDHEEKEVSGA